MPSIPSRREQERLPIAFQRSRPLNSQQQQQQQPSPQGNSNGKSSQNRSKERTPTSSFTSTFSTNTNTKCNKNTTIKSTTMSSSKSKKKKSPAPPTPPANCKVDRFGFITNMDATGRLTQEDDNNTKQSPNSKSNKHTNGNGTSNGGSKSEGGPGGGSGEVLSGSVHDSKRMERREKKWSSMMNSWDTTNRRRQKLVLNRLRKGLPDSMRDKVWPLLGGVNKKLRPGSSTNRIYKELLKQCAEDNQNALDTFPPEGPNQSLARMTLGMRSNSFQNIQETIERDIHRTYPRHSLFYDEENHKDDLAPPTQPAPPPEEPKQEDTDDDHDDDDDDDSQAGLGALCNEDLSNLMMELDVGTSSKVKKKNSSGGKKKKNTDDSSSKAAKAKEDATAAAKLAAIAEQKRKHQHQTCESMVEAKGGQGALRRVLCAYSYYDREVGYCQGMNFIAAMFITIMPEKEAFWMLVSIMNDKPCELRGLFGKGMTWTHKVLFVAEKLIHHFLPKLAKHLDNENIHVTMYATQWLLTQYTSSFNFDLVTRVWDCFLVEGFKTIYRVMLALLQMAQPILLKMSFEEILGFFRDMPDTIDGNLVMETAMKIPLKRKHIAKYESNWKAEQEGNN